MVEIQPTLGAKLREHREALGLTINTVARKINMAPELIRALEESRYDAFSAKVYALGAIKRLHTSLNPRDTGSDWVSTFHEEWARALPVQSQKPISRQRTYVFYLTPLRFIALAATGGFLLFLAFMGFQVKAFLGSPSLVIEEPLERSIVSRQYVRIRGTTGKESQLTVNGREIILDSDGAFDQDMELTKGLNTLEFTIQNRFGKSAREVRHIVVK